MFCGISPHSVAYPDLERGGLKLKFGARWIKKFPLEMMQKGPMGFEECADAIKWCKSQVELGMSMRSPDKKLGDKGRSRITVTPRKYGYLTDTKYTTSTLKKMLSRPSEMVLIRKDYSKICFLIFHVRPHRKTLGPSMIS